MAKMPKPGKKGMPAFLKEGSPREEKRDKKAAKRMGMSDMAYEKSGRDAKVDKGVRMPFPKRMK